MARNYRIQKRRRKKNSFSTSVWISNSARVRGSPPFQRENSRIFHGTSVPRVTARAPIERYSPRKETWADKTGSGATGCDRGNQRTHYIAVTEAEEGKLFDILLT